MTRANPAARRILVIKLSALGDVVLATGPFAAIRRHHADAHITLLTTAPHADLLGASPWFDEVWIDERPTLRAPGRWLALRKRLRGGNFDRVYDLQTSDRSGWYFRLMGPGTRPDWSGIARGCSLPHANPERVTLHTIARHKDQLAVAGIDNVPPPDLSWAEADISRFGLDGRYVLLVPGAARHRPRKRWPADHYAELARELADLGVTPAILAGIAPQEIASATAIADACPGGRVLLDAGVAEVAALARGAAGAIGNDTGLMHIIAACRCPSLVLFSADSDPSLACPPGDHVTALRRDDLADLPVAEVARQIALR
ncbi:MAG: glycosyltransferase family 9 protein [Alphaproteobacteria bacterium]